MSSTRGHRIITNILEVNKPLITVTPTLQFCKNILNDYFTHTNIMQVEINNIFLFIA